MIKENKKPKTAASSSEIVELREELRKLESQSEFARTLVRLSCENLENDSMVLNADEIMSELGRSRYE